MISDARIRQIIAEEQRRFLRPALSRRDYRLLRLSRAKQRQARLMANFSRPPLSAFVVQPASAQELVRANSQELVRANSQERRAAAVEATATLGSLLRTVGPRRRSGRVQERKGPEVLQRELNERLLASQRR